MPLSHITKQRVTNLYDVMDAAYCSKELHDHCRELGHAPRSITILVAARRNTSSLPDEVRYRERTVAERTNARPKDEFGGRNIMVEGHAKVMSHLMFGLLALGADQLMRLRRCPDLSQ